MSFSATNAHPEKKFWIREHRNSRNPEDRTLKRSQGLSQKPIQGGWSQYQEQVARERGRGGQNATNGRPSQPAAIGPVSGTPGPLSTPRLHSTSLTSVAPSDIQERHYSRPLLGNVAYSQYPVSAVSSTRNPAITNANTTTPSRTPSIAHITHSTPAASVVSAAKSHASTGSATPHSAPGNYHPHPPQAVSIPPQVTNSSYASSAARVATSTAPESPLLLPAPRERSRVSSEVSVTPSTASGKYPALPAPRDSSRTSSVISAVQSRVPESHPPLTESRVQNYRAPSVISVASSGASMQHPPLSVSRVPSEVQNPQPSRSQSVVSAGRSTVREDRLLLSASGSRSPSVAPTELSVIEDSSGYLQESHSRDPSRASSSRALALRSPSSQPPVSRAASVTPSIRSEHTVSIPSAERRRAEEVYAISKVGNSSNVAESSVRSRRPSVVHCDQNYAAPVRERATSVAASTKSRIKSGCNERDISIASTARRHAREEDSEPRIQSKSTSKRASSIKPSRSERGGSIVPKARSHIELDDHESSSERAPTSKRALSKVSSSKSSRKLSRDDRGRSTASRTRGSYDESAEVRATYDEHEEAKTKSQSRSERSRSVSTHRSSSVSSTKTIRALRPGADNALVVYHDNALHTAEASEDATRRRSSRRKKKPDIDVRSYVGSDDVTVVLPDPSEVGEAGRASGSQDQQKQQQYREKYQEWQRQQQQPQQQYQRGGRYQQSYPQPYPQPDPQPYIHTYPPQYRQQQQPPYPAYGYPNVQPQYPTPQYTHPPYPDPRYTYPQPTAQSYNQTADASYPSPYVTPTPQYGTGYENLGEELEQSRKSGRLPKARDKRREKVERPRRTTRLGGKYEEPPEIYESKYDDGEFPDRWFDN